MKTQDAVCLVALGMIWGMSFLFVRVAVPEFGALPLMELRIVLAAAVLMPLVMVRHQIGEVLVHWRPIALMGVIHYAVPFSLFAYAMLTLPAGYSSVINASAPLFTGLVARLWLGQRLGRSRVTGLALGLAGVGLLAWDKLATGGGPDALAVAATIAAACCYGFAVVLAKRHLAGVSPTAVAGGSMSFAAIALLPFAIAYWPAANPTVEAWSMVGALGLVCTALAFVLYFRLIASAGPANSITVTFLIPAFALVFGAVLLDEQVSLTMIAGGVVIALGTALATGIVELGSCLRRVRMLAIRAVIVAGVAAIFAGTPGGARAQAFEVRAPVYVAGNVFSYREGGRWDTFATVAASVELELVPLDRLWLVSVFAEIHGAMDDDVDGTVFAGALAKAWHRDWEITGYLFDSRYPGAASRRTVMARLRYRLDGGARIGVEYLSYVDDPGAGELKAAYYVSFGRSGQLRLLAGTDLRQGWAPLGRMEISWQL